MFINLFPSRRLPAHMAQASRLVCLLLLSAVPAVHAARPYPKVIRDAVTNGVTVVKTFPATSGLTGWVLHQDGTYSMAFTTADGKTLMMGNLINEKGENLTERYAEKYFPKPERAAWYKQLAQSAYVADGAIDAPKSVLYVFVAANCPNCRLLSKALQPYHRAGLQVRWIPVARLGSSGMAAAINLLGAADKTQALRQMLENTPNSNRATPRIPRAAQRTLAIKIQRNNAQLEKSGIADAPVIVWKDRTQKVRVTAGMPQLSDIPTITELPRQDVDDPELAKFR